MSKFHFARSGDARSEGSASARRPTPGSLLRDAGVAPPGAEAGDFCKRLAQVEKDKPANSRIVVAVDQGAVIFMADRPRWSEAHFEAGAGRALVLLRFAFTVFVMGLAASPYVVHRARTTGDWNVLLYLAMGVVGITFLLFLQALPALSNLLNIFGRWQIIATPGALVLRRSLWNFGVTTVIDPKFVLAGGPDDRLSVDDKRRLKFGSDRYRDVIVALNVDDAEWLERALRTLYPQLEEVKPDLSPPPTAFMKAQHVISFFARALPRR